MNAAMRNEWAKIFETQQRALKKHKTLLTAVYGKAGGELGDIPSIDESKGAADVFKKHRKGFDALSRSAAVKPK